MSGSILTELIGGLTGDSMSGLSQQLGVDENMTSQAISLAIPLLLSALANNTSNEKGAQSLANALGRDHDGSILNDVAGHVQSGSLDDGLGILGHVLGANQSKIEESLSERTGLDATSITKLLAILAPVVLGKLGKQQKQKNLDPTGLSALLGTESKQASQSTPDLLGLLGGLLSTGVSDLLD